MTSESSMPLLEPIDDEWVKGLIHGVGYPHKLEDFRIFDQKISGPATDEQAILWLRDQLQTIRDYHWGTKGMFESVPKQVAVQAADISNQLGKVLKRIKPDLPGEAGNIKQTFLFAGIYAVIPRERGSWFEAINDSIESLEDLRGWFDALSKRLAYEGSDLRKVDYNGWEQQLRTQLAQCYATFWRRTAGPGRNGETQEPRGPFLSFIQPSLERITGRPHQAEAIIKAFQRQKARSKAKAQDILLKK